MTYTVTVTSQGQITVPISVRRSLFAKNKKQKLLMSVINNRILLELPAEKKGLVGSIAVENLPVFNSGQEFADYLSGGLDEEYSG